MYRLKPEELPAVLTDEILYILAEMAEEIPVSDEWIKISGKLTDEQKFLVYEWRSVVKSRKEEQRKESLTEKEREEEDRRWREAKDNPDLCWCELVARTKNKVG